jgi:hypothetical protein
MLQACKRDGAVAGQLDTGTLSFPHQPLYEAFPTNTNLSMVHPKVLR